MTSTKLSTVKGNQDNFQISFKYHRSQQTNPKIVGDFWRTHLTFEKHDPQTGFVTYGGLNYIGSKAKFQRQVGSSW